MKKFLLIIGCLLFFMNNAKAQVCVYSCVEPYDLSPGVTRFMSAVTGSSFLAEEIAEIIIEKEIRKTVKGRLDVDIDSYSVKDLKNGIFKSIVMRGSNINLNGIFFKAIRFETLCDFNYISLVDPSNPIFKEDLVLGFSMEFSENELNNSMATDNYKRIISDINRLSGSLGVFKISSTEVKIRNDNFYYIIKVAIPFVRNTQNIVLTSDLKVNRGDINLSNTRLANESISFDLRKIDRIINFLNPLDFSLNILENKNTKITIQNVKIKNDKIYVEGYLIIPKNEDLAYER